MTQSGILQLKLQQYELLQKKEAIKAKLPHLYGYPWYPWAKQFFESKNKVNLLCAANQISKSSTQIRKMIHWATNPAIWPDLWTTQPRQFWYLYPSKDVVYSEWKTKWEPEFMPRDDMANHPYYGWRIKNKLGVPYEIQFNTGVNCFFKTYSQDTQHLQSGTVHGIFTDEELPEDIYDELMLRLAASQGYFHMVFTATIGQDFWRRAVERIGHKDETLKGAFKQQISMYDCQQYEDGSPAPWSEKRITEVKNKCKSPNEVKRRVYGRFVLDSGLKYPSYSRELNMVAPFTIPSNWLIYSGVDIGSGGPKAHPAAIAFVAVQPDFKKAVVFRGWKGSKKDYTTSKDILARYRLLRGPMRPVMQCYDHAAADFKIYVSRLGETFVPAEKGQELGEDIINVLFKNQILDIFDIPEFDELDLELTSLLKETKKRFAKDDFIDALRYAVTQIPWDWSVVADDIGAEKVRVEKEKSEIDKRREFIFEDTYKKEEDERVEDEIESYNELFAF